MDIASLSWSKISHMATGRSVIERLPTLKRAKELVKDLSQYKVFLMPCIETWGLARRHMEENDPVRYDKLLKIISSGG